MWGGELKARPVLLLLPSFYNTMVFPWQGGLGVKLA
jgi:hypothetical protein